MTTAASDRSPLLWAESWAVQVAVEADSPEHRMEVALASAPVDDQPSQVAEAIRELIAEARLGRDDPRQAEIQHLGELQSGPVKRARVRQAEEVTYDASDQLHVRVRVFRNTLFAAGVLKVPSGALTAVVGILLLGGGFVPGFSELDSQRQILAYAPLFGYAQQLGTRFIDDRAKAIVNGLPSKAPEGQQPQPAPASTTSRPTEPGAETAS